MNKQNLILLLISIFTWVIYLSYIMVRYGVQPSISDTVKLLKYKVILWIVLIIGITPLAIVGNTSLMIISMIGGWLIASTPIFWETNKKGEKNIAGKLHLIGAFIMIIGALLSYWLDFDKLPVVIIYILSYILAKINLKYWIWWIEVLSLIYAWTILFSERVLI